ncbi:MAG: hypothetical protein ABI229_07925 [Gemmatimonadaceae bacterium]
MPPIEPVPESEAEWTERASPVESRLTESRRGAWLFGVVSRFTVAFGFDIGIGIVPL